LLSIRLDKLISDFLDVLNIQGAELPAAIVLKHEFPGIIGGIIAVQVKVFALVAYVIVKGMEMRHGKAEVPDPENEE
jgi:hypothetical protein